MNINERFDRLDAYIRENRILRSRWSDLDADGREHACLIVALAPEVGAQGAVAQCPADVIPAWLAYLTPALDDGVSMAAWPEIVQKYARVVRMGATTLDDAGWRRVQARFLLAVDPSLEGETVPTVAAALWSASRAEVLAEAWAAASRAARAASEAASNARWAASGAGRAAAWDRMARALFAAIEAECGEHRREEDE